MSTLKDLTREIGELEIPGNPFKNDVKGWVNRAIRAIAERRNWSWMHSQESVTIPAGQTSVALPARWKGLATQNSPVTYTAPNASFPSPVKVRSRAELERMSPGAFGNVVNASGAWTPFYVFIERNGGTWTLNYPLTFPAPANATYALSCYLFPEALELGTDSNGCTENSRLTEAIINWVKWKALKKADPEGQAARATFQDLVLEAATEDARALLAGRPVRW